MWHKPCRTFHPWCLCIKTRCLYLYAAHFVTVKALSTDVVEQMVPIKHHFLMSSPVSIRRKQQCFGDLNWNRLAAWALSWHQSTPLCVPMYSNWPQPRKNTEAVLLRQAYWTSVCGPCAFICGTFMADATRQDCTESRSCYDWLRAGASELWIQSVVCMQKCRNW